MQTKNLPGECQHCGEPISFPADVAGTTSVCPHCRQPTELVLALPSGNDSSGRTKAIVFTVILLVILLGGIGGAVLALQRAQRMSARLQASRAREVSPASSPSSDSFAAAGFRVSPVKVEQGQGNATAYAVGSIGNLANRQRHGVRVELDLFDANGGKVGKAQDSRPTLDPNEEWQFRAMITVPRTVSAKITAITADH